MDYYTAMKKKEILTFATTWMDFSVESNMAEIRDQHVGQPGVGGKGNGEILVKCYKFSFIR